jgi:hypothetical protein
MLFILIPGLILVALMIYASTRIKKTAAAAYDAETIETDEFVIQKPEGFLHNLNGDPKYIFEAYSKEYSKANDKLRIGTATITRFDGETIDGVANDLITDDATTDDETQIIDEHRYRLVTRDKDIDGVKAAMSYKLAEKNGNVYKLEITSLEERASSPWAETFSDSFRVK